MQKDGIRHSLSVVLPVYNEEMTLVKTLHHVLDTLHEWHCDFEVIVVNDGSVDRTRLILDTIASINPHVRVIHHATHRGYATALNSGLATLTKRLVFFMGTDGQYDIRDLSAFFPLLEVCDGVVGYRIERQDSLPRRFRAWCWRILTGMVFDVYVRDVTCSFKLFPAAFFQEHTLETHTALCDMEILYKFTRAGYTFGQHGVRQLQPSRRTSVDGDAVRLLPILQEMLVYAWKWHREERKEADQEEKDTAARKPHEK